MINIGAYVKGSNPKIDIALKKIDPVNKLSDSASNERVGCQDAFAAVDTLTGDTI